MDDKSCDNRPKLTNKQWLASLSATDFYIEFKRAEEIGKRYTSSSQYVIMWLDEERRADVSKSNV